MYINPQQIVSRIGAVVAREFKGSRFGFDKALTDRMNEYCKATDKVATKVIIRAVREYLDREEGKKSA